MKQITIAIDFDGTWSADPLLFSAFAQNAKLRGHRVIIATGRKEWSDDMGRAMLPTGIQIIYCNGQLKEQVCRQYGIAVDIWIDDMPGMIQDCRIIKPSEDKEL